MSRRVRPEVVRRRLVALLDPSRMDVWSEVERSVEWEAGYAEGLRTARRVLRKGG